MDTNPNDMSCKELVELVTDYLEGALPPADLLRFELHIGKCDWCKLYIDQIRTHHQSRRQADRGLHRSARQRRTPRRFPQLEKTLISGSSTNRALRKVPRSACSKTNGPVGQANCCD